MMNEINAEYELLSAEGTTVEEIIQEVAPETNEGINVEFKGWEQFGKSFGYMGFGMLGIFLVTCILILTVTALNKLQNKKKDEKKDQ